MSALVQSRVGSVRRQCEAGRGGHPDGLALELLGMVEDVAQHGEAVVVADAQRCHQGKVVDAGHDGVDGAHVGVEDEAEPELQADQFVAEPDGAHRCPGRLTARHSAVSGLLTFNNVASGAYRSTSAAMRITTGMLRREREMPPGPTESPTGCQIP
jgi:SLT domain-containing protein